MAAEGAVPAGFDPAYLAAKASIDERSLHPRVWSAFAAACRKTPGRMALLDLGAGTGSMLVRLLERAGLSDFDYTALDRDPRLLAGLDELRGKAAARGVAISPVGDTLENFLAEARPESFDALVSHAFLDLVDIPAVLGRLLGLLRPGGVFYFTQVFDGLTCFLPADPADAGIIERYHASMKRGLPGGVFDGSRAGRQLAQLLLEAGRTGRVSLLDIGASDWAVLPGPPGCRPDERLLLSAMLGFIEGSAGGAAGCGPWLARRRRELAEGRLGLLTHQWDFAGTVA